LAFHEGLVQELKHRYNASRVRTTYVCPNATNVVHLDPAGSVG
jgi:hypothetical protein